MVWADLQFALDKLLEPVPDTYMSLLRLANLDIQFGDGLFSKFFLTQVPSTFYLNAKFNSDMRISHEAIEIGLKAILLDRGFTIDKVRNHGHNIPRLLEDVKKHNPKAFNDLERCFDSTIRYLKGSTGIQRNTIILEYFQKYGTTKVFVRRRYESIDSTNELDRGWITLFQIEMIRALLALIFERTPKDIVSRIEEEVTDTIRSEKQRDLTWDAEEWISQGSIFERLQDVESLRGNKVLRAVVRRCAKRSECKQTELWANRIRRGLMAARK